MATIDPTTQLASMIRARFGAQIHAQAQRRPAPGAKAARVAQSDAPGTRLDATTPTVVSRVRALSPDDPQRRRKAFRIFLESVLVQAFGRERLDDPGFDELVDTVLLRMESDAALDAALREAGDRLLAEADSGGRAGEPSR